MLPIGIALKNQTSPAASKSITANLKHVRFWDRVNDKPITISNLYSGFRGLGFSVVFSIRAFLIHFFFPQSSPQLVGRFVCQIIC